MNKPSSPSDPGSSLLDAPEAGVETAAGSAVSKQAPRRIWQAGTLTYTSGGLAVLFFWLLWGDFAWLMKERSAPAIVQLLLKQFHASDLLTGLLLGSLPQAMATVVTPIIAYRSDRHRGKWGRRIPYLLIPTPITVAAMLGLAFCVPLGHGLHDLLGAASPGSNACVLLALSIAWSLFEFGTYIVHAVFHGLINDVVPNELLGRFYGLFRGVGLAAGVLFNYWIFGKAEDYYTWIFIALAALYGVGFTLMCLRVKEGRYPPIPQAAPGERRGAVAAVKTYFRECFSHPYYLLAFTVLSLGWGAFIPANIFNVFFAKSVGMSMDTFGKCLALTFLVSFALSVPLGWLADRFHPIRAGLVALLLYGVAMLFGGILVENDRSFAVAFIAHGVLSGTWMTLIASFPQRLFPRARFAQFNSAVGVVQHLTSMAIGPLIGAMLDTLNHDYNYTYIASAVIALSGVVVWFFLYLRFKAFGGVREYRPPG